MITYVLNKYYLKLSSIVITLLNERLLISIDRKSTAKAGYWVVPTSSI